MSVAEVKKLIACGNVGALQDMKMNHKLTLEGLRFYNHAYIIAAIKFGQVCVLQFFKQWVETDKIYDKPSRLTLSDIRANGHNILREAARSGQVEVLRFFKEWRDPVGPGPRNQEGLGLTVHDLRDCGNECIRVAAYGGHVDAVVLLRDWVTPLCDGTLDRLTIQDLRAHDNEALKNAMARRCIPILQLFKDWPRGSESWTLADLDASNNWARADAQRCGHADVCTFMQNWETELRASMSVCEEPTRGVDTCLPLATKVSDPANLGQLESGLVTFVQSVSDTALTNYPVLLAVSKAAKASINE
jgi:hypothetical protein